VYSKITTTEEKRVEEK